MQTQRKVVVHDFPDLSNYKTMWEFQEKIQKEVIDNKPQGDQAPAGHLIFCEHPHVYTLGRYGDSNNMLLDYLKLQAVGAEDRKSVV